MYSGAGRKENMGISSENFGENVKFSENFCNI